ncbi:MAG TPA: radical SAM protein [Nannocystaceae bacterium]|nr:radical SAM protein [Nannocystaceae bacterium]
MEREPEVVIAALLGPLRPGARLGDGSRVVAIGGDMGLAIELEVDGVPLDVELVPRAAARHERVLTDAFAIGYRTDERGPLPARALAACRAVAEAIAPHEAQVLQELATPTTSPRIREIAGGRLLAPARAGPRSFYRISPYRGCAIGCRFCYAQSRLQPLRALLGLPAAPWGSWIDARVDAAAVLARELVDATPRPIKFCPIVSDPYQAIEAKLRLTRACLEALRDWPAPVLVLTRAAAILDDVDRIAALREPWAGVSLPTIDDAVRSHFEPRAASVDDRIHVLRSLRAAGVRTFAVVQPLLPGNIDGLADALAATVDGVAIGVLHGEESATALFDDPRFAPARTDAWQRERALALRDALCERGIAVWEDELPPEVAR